MAKKILIIDDEITTTNFLKLALEETGKYQVKVENRGSKGLEAARMFKPDLILLDIEMPDLEGSEVGRQIRSDPSIKSTKIIFFTGAITAQEAGPEGRVIGGEVFLSKPIAVERLSACIEKYSKS